MDLSFSPEEIPLLSSSLLTWYAANRRKLPWRGDAPPYASSAPRVTGKRASSGAAAESAGAALSTASSSSSSSSSSSAAPPTSPYGTWVSEIMLQQTRVEAVVPHWLRWMSRFPDVASLAAASEDEVVAAWAGLGYYRRARSLRAGAAMVLSRFGGALPARAAELRELPGVGEYTAGAIASIAYGAREAVVDGNVVRVLCRLRAVRAEARAPATGRAAWAAARALVPAGAPGDFNQALMELGATVCTPQTPGCGGCPLVALCRGHAAARAALGGAEGGAAGRVAASGRAEGGAAPSSEGADADVIVLSDVEDLPVRPAPRDGTLRGFLTGGGASAAPPAQATAAAAALSRYIAAHFSPTTERKPPRAARLAVLVLEARAPEGGPLYLMVRDVRAGPGEGAEGTGGAGAAGAGGAKKGARVAAARTGASAASASAAASAGPRAGRAPPPASALLEKQWRPLDLALDAAEAPAPEGEEGEDVGEGGEGGGEDGESLASAAGAEAARGGGAGAPSAAAARAAPRGGAAAQAAVEAAAAQEDAALLAALEAEVGLASLSLASRALAGRVSHAFSHVRFEAAVRHWVLRGPPPGLRPRAGLEARWMAPAQFQAAGLTTWACKALHPALAAEAAAAAVGGGAGAAGAAGAAGVKGA